MRPVSVRVWRRVAIAGLSRGEWPGIVAAITELQARVKALEPGAAADDGEYVECDPEKELPEAVRLGNPK